MSRFKTDHFVLPETETAAAIARALPPDATQLLLPPAVESVLAEAQAAAAQQAQQAQQAAQRAPEAPADASGLADAFLSSLAADLMGGEAAGAQQPQPQEAPPPLPPGAPPPLPPGPAPEGEGAEAEVAAAVAERPIDLFKAIFEDSEEEEEERAQLVRQGAACMAGRRLNGGKLARGSPAGQGSASRAPA